MLALKLNNTFLNLPEKASASFTLTNPLFDNDSFVRSYSFPFTLPATHNNLLALGFPTAINFSGQKKFENVVLFLEGVPFETGILEITGVTNKSIKVVFRNPELDLLEELGKIKINEILETIIVPQVGNPQLILRTPTIPQYYALSINGMGFALDATNPPYDEAVEVAGYFVGVINAVFPGLASASTPDQLILATTTHDVILINGFIVQAQSSLPVVRHDSMLVFAKNIQENPDTRIAFPIIYNSDFYDGKNPVFLGYINYYRSGGQIVNTEQDKPGHETTFSPQIRLPYLFNQIIENSDIINAIGGDFWAEPETQQLLIYSNRALDQLYKYLSITGQTKYRTAFVSSFNLNQFVPEISAADALKLLDYAAVFYRIEGKTLVVTRKSSQLNRTPIDWTKKAETEYGIDFEKKEGFSFEFPNDNSDFYNRSELATKQVGDAKKRIILPTGTLNEDTRSWMDDNNNTWTWKVPIIAQHGSSDALELGENETSIKLLLYKGMKNDSTGGTYPFATHKDKDFQTNNIGSYTLNWIGEKGLYETFWRKYAPLLEADSITKSLRLDVGDLLEIKQWKNSRRIIVQEEGTIHGVIKRVQFKAGPTGISIATVEFASEM